MADLADDLRRLLDRLGLDRVLAAGHSMGGRILLELAATTPDRIAAMVLSGAQSAYLAHMSDAESADYVARRRAMFEGGSVATARALAQSVMAPGAPSEAIDRLTRDFTLLNCDGYLAAIEASISWDRDGELSDLTMPVTVIGGALDGICPPEECHRIAARIGQGPAVILDGVGHMAQIEAPDRVTGILADFARRHGALASPIDTKDIQ
jgi:pimeloyl-ACP methyl ester carboxylesterase